MIVQDVLPAGLPASSDRYDAVTEPWMLKPPLNATWLGGQSTVNCLSPDDAPPATVMMAEPSIPAGPAGP
jgi:hypothetical protein